MLNDETLLCDHITEWNDDGNNPVTRCKNPAVWINPEPYPGCVTALCQNHAEQRGIFPPNEPLPKLVKVTIWPSVHMKTHSPGKWWKRAPEMDKNGGEAWRHFWTGSVIWLKSSAEPSNVES